MTYKGRDIAQLVDRALASLPVVVLTGMRQTGKSTFLERQPEIATRRYASFDNFAQLEAARRNPEAFLAGDLPMTIDEAQKYPEIITAIKNEVDRDRRVGRFLLSGSANFALLKQVSESLAGRAIYLTLHPFHRRELLGFQDKPPFLPAFFRLAAPRPPSAEGGEEFSLGRLEGAGTPGIVLNEEPDPIADAEILRGGMPSVVLGEATEPALWFECFIQSYLERDLRSLSQVADLIAFRRLMRLAALRTAQMLNQAELGRDAKLTAMTAGRYLDLLETSYVITRLPAYLGNRSSRVVKTPKLFLADSGLAAHMAGVKDLLPQRDEPLRGPLFETYVAQNLLAILAARWPEARLHYWLMHGRHEVDFVIEAGSDCIAIEVKAATRWTGGDLAGLKAFLSGTPHCRAAILAHNGRDAVSLGDRLWALPVGLIIS